MDRWRRLQNELETAIENTQSTGKTTALTSWKNAWLAKNAANEFILAGELENKRIRALADVVEAYQDALNEKGLYDFDDMITRAIQALETHKDLRYTLQEQYQYLLLDEFQDTNAAQLRLVELLTDNPVNEGRPNVLAVGDDDQAIYAFQGAQYSNMLDFYQLFSDVTVINLTQNYRSHTDILHTAHNIAEQIGSRLHHNFKTMSKTLAANAPYESATIGRHEFVSEVAEYDWIAAEIESLIKGGVPASEIAVLAPQHKYLEPLVPYLNNRDIAVRYEKRENILEAPIIRELLAMAALVIALKEGNTQLQSALWPEVLSFSFWNIPTSTIWKLSWKVNDSSDLAWSQALLEDQTLRTTALFFLALAGKVTTSTLEDMLDYLIGSREVETNEPDMPFIRSPLREYYTGKTVLRTQPDLFFQTISHLTVLREKLREHQKATTTTLTLPDLLRFVDVYQQAGERMLNTSPYNQNVEAVQLMTVFKAKGLEFQHVFLPRCHDDVWGESSRGNSNKITLPRNLAPIRHAGMNQDERLRLFFVAITRAKIGLYLTSFSTSFSGKTTKKLKYLDEQTQDDGTAKSIVLPEHAQGVHQNNNEAISLADRETHWQLRHISGIQNIQLQAMLEDRLQNYQLSPTHLNAFIDLEHSGPEAFFFNTILRFPQGPTADGQFGNAIHETLEWLQRTVNTAGSLPELSQTISHFTAQMRRKHLSEAETALLIERGERALTTYLAARREQFEAGNITEHNFRNENVQLGEVRMGGKIDLMEINQKEKTITVVDYKTGKPCEKWASDLKLHKYKQQLYCYKLLIENSRTYREYKVTSGRLEFIEPDVNGATMQLELTFEEAQLERTKQLLKAVWQRIKNLNFKAPDLPGSSLSDIKKFEQELIAEADLGS
ncbi:MAG: ATP-dependent DNA helicase [Candidatus Saccharimonadales bacterium]